MRTARWCALALAVVLTPALLGACGSGTPAGNAIAESTSTTPASGPDATSSTQTPTSGPSAGPGGHAPSSSGPGGADVPTLPPPSGAPRTPSDLMPTGVLVGTIAADSDGSCYTLRTDDNDVYALVGGDRRPLARGTVVRARTTSGAPAAPAGCQGEPVAITSIEPV